MDKTVLWMVLLMIIVTIMTQNNINMSCLFLAGWPISKLQLIVRGLRDNHRETYFTTKVKRQQGLITPVRHTRLHTNGRIVFASPKWFFSSVQSVSLWKLPDLAASQKQNGVKGWSKVKGLWHKAALCFLLWSKVRFQRGFQRQYTRASHGVYRKQVISRIEFKTFRGDWQCVWRYHCASSRLCVCVGLQL